MCLFNRTNLLKLIFYRETFHLADSQSDENDDAEENEFWHFLIRDKAFKTAKEQQFDLKIIRIKNK